MYPTQDTMGMIDTEVGKNDCKALAKNAMVLVEGRVIGCYSDSQPGTRAGWM